MNAIQSFQFNNIPVSFRDDGYLNATMIASHFGKLPKDYLKSEQTQQYISVLAENLSVRRKILTKENQIVIVKRGGIEQGTWLHPKLAVHFARWLDPKFAVWCDEQIEQILSGSPQTRKALPSGLTYEQQEQVKALHRMLVGAVPREHQAKLAITLWSSIKSKFKVGYKDVPPEQFLEVLSLMSRVAVEKGVQYSEADTVNLETVPKLFANQANIPFNLNRNAYYAVTVKGGKIYRHLVSYITSPYEDGMIPCLAHQV
ncbi:KilA-N domain-containing protein [Eikenella sp. NML03-A-027]|uniref:KilA-N domain-containing protein n=1 Tax=Eikenella sp. NML03-A-027 TaxID=1795828 RepID=UPI0009EF4709|nr:KilA-N domain-containing protein [Eikenella sp. NML03-A-027]